MSIIENNYIAACNRITEQVNEESQKAEFKQAKFIVTQVAYNKDSFEFLSAAFTPTDSPTIPAELAPDKYYNMAFIANTPEEVIQKFKDKLLFEIAYSEMRFALTAAYKKVLSSQNGETTYEAFFEKPHIKDYVWAYKEVLKMTNLGLFGCWMNRDREFKHVNIQVDADFMSQYDTLLKSEMA